MAAPAPSPATTREYGLDWLRVLAFLVLIFYHSGMVFVSWEFHIKNAQTSDVLEYLMLFPNRWRLGLLFFISGAGVAFALKRRTWAQFAAERCRKLFLPLLFGMLVIVPPQIYYERLLQGRQFTSYWDFYRSVFEFQAYPQGSFSWHHLWFVAYIFVYSLLGIPVFAWLRSASGQRAIDALERGLRHRWAVYLVNVPNLVIALWLGPKWPTTHNLVADWANLIGSFVTFLWGFVLCSRRGILDLLTARRQQLLLQALYFTATFYLVRANPISWTGETRRIALTLLSSYMGMLWIFTLLGYARARLNFDHWFVRYGNEAVYPFYIVHQTVLIAIGYYVIQWPWGILPKLLVLMAGTFLGSWAIYELVRRTPPTRLLFGLKP